MNDMLATIVPKSDQTNADDLIGGRTMTITVSSVEIRMDEQPVTIRFIGDEGKPYRPGKSMRRVLVNAWGPDANVYVGRSMTLYRDDGVKFGGADVGGIRISHLSHIERPLTMALTATRAIRKPFTVKPLATPAPQVAPSEPPTQKPRQTLAQWIATSLPALLAPCQTVAELEEVTGGKFYVAALAKATDAQKAEMQVHLDAALDRVTATADDAAEADVPDDFSGPDLPAKDAA